MTISRIARRITTQTSTRVRKTGRHDTIARLHANLTAYADRRNRGTTTAGQYLRDVLGLDPEFAAFCDSPFGKAIKKAYIALHGDEPTKIRLVAVGRRLHRKIGYVLGEPALQIATRTYPRTANLAPKAPEASIEPTALAAEIADRYFERTMPLARTCRAYVAQRVADIVEGMHGTRENYDPSVGMLTDAGAALVTQIISNDAAEGLAWREIGQIVDAAALIGA